MLRVDPKIIEPHVGDAGGYMVSLVDGEPIKPGRDGGARDPGRYKEKKQAAEENYANPWYVPASCRGLYNIRSVAKSFIQAHILRGAFGRHFKRVHVPGERRSISARRLNHSILRGRAVIVVRPIHRVLAGSRQTAIIGLSSRLTAFRSVARSIGRAAHRRRLVSASVRSSPSPDGGHRDLLPTGGKK